MYSYARRGEEEWKTQVDEMDGKHATRFYIVYNITMPDIHDDENDDGGDDDDDDDDDDANNWITREDTPARSDKQRMENLENRKEHNAGMNS